VFGELTIKQLDAVFSTWLHTQNERCYGGSLVTPVIELIYVEHQREIWVDQFFFYSF